MSSLFSLKYCCRHRSIWYAILILLLLVITSILLVNFIGEDEAALVCDEETTSSVASNLAAAISIATTNSNLHSWHVHVIIPSRISGLTDEERTSFDAPSIIVDPSNNKDTDGSNDEVSLTAVFHTGVGGSPGKLAIYVAHTSTILGQVPNPQDGWNVTSKLSDAGFMGHLYLMPDGTIFFAYEVLTNNYNTIGIRLYKDIETLRSGGSWRREVQLQRAIFLDQTHKTPVLNLGTPTITKVVQEDDNGTLLHIRFHYYPHDRSLDLPGVGSIVFPPSTGEEDNSTVITDYNNWNGRFEIDVKNAMRGSQAMGDVGMRADIFDDKFLLYSAQMADSGEGFIDWLSWRPILYPLGCENPVASILPLTLPQNLQTLAAPHVTYMGNRDYILLSFFVPSEPFDSTKTSQYELYYDKEKCPTCNPMNVAQIPARSGTFLVIVRTSCALDNIC